MDAAYFAGFCAVFGFAAAYCGWCLCLAAKRGDEVMEGALTGGNGGNRDEVFEPEIIFGARGLVMPVAAGQAPLQHQRDPETQG